METKSRVRVKFPPTKVHHLVRKKQTNNEKKNIPSPKKNQTTYIINPFHIYIYTLPHTNST